MRRALWFSLRGVSRVRSSDQTMKRSTSVHGAPISSNSKSVHHAQHVRDHRAQHIPLRNAAGMVPRLKMPVIGLPRPAGSAAVASHVGLRRDPRVPPRLLPTHAAVPVAQQFDSEKLPQTLVSEIRPSLRAGGGREPAPRRPV